MTDTKQEEPLNTHIMSELSKKYSVAETLDTSGTRCPIPLLRAKKALKSLNEQEHLLVLATDPSAKGDFDAMLKHLPHDLVDYKTVVEPTRVDYFVIQKGANLVDSTVKN